jgi:hypothetical protein
MFLTPCIFLQSIRRSTNALNKTQINKIHDKYQTPTCFGTGCQPQEVFQNKRIQCNTLIYVLITLTRIIKILKSMKLTSIKSKCCGTKNYVIVSCFQDTF